MVLTPSLWTKHLCVTIQMKAIKGTVTVYYAIKLYKVVLTRLSILWMKHWCVTIQMKAMEQYFHVVLFIMLYKVVPTFKSVDETLLCGHSNESY